jgi:hypothetical protein
MLLSAGAGPQLRFPPRLGAWTCGQTGKKGWRFPTKLRFD